MHLFHSYRLVLASSALVGLVLTAPMAAAAPPPNLLAGCADTKTAQEFEAAFRAAAVQRHSLPALTCAAALSFAAAGKSQGNMDLQIMALDAQINLLEQIQLQLDSQTYQGGDAYEDLKARWALGLRQGRMLSARLSKPSTVEPTLATLRIIFELVSVSATQFVKPEAAFRIAATTIQPLAALAEKNPRLLDGMAEVILARLFYQLPESAGGDLDQAVVHARKGHETSPTNIVAQRWYAETLVAVNRKDEARTVLTRMAALGEPEVAERQSFVDELRAGIGLAERAGDSALSQQLLAKRRALLKAHPELKTRAPAAISGHGGPDPLTGKPVD